MEQRIVDSLNRLVGEAADIKNQLKAILARNDDMGSVTRYDKKGGSDIEKTLQELRQQSQISADTDAAILAELKAHTAILEKAANFSLKGSSEKNIDSFSVESLANKLDISDSLDKQTANFSDKILTGVESIASATERGLRKAIDPLMSIQKQSAEYLSEMLEIFQEWMPKVNNLAKDMNKLTKEATTPGSIYANVHGNVDTPKTDRALEELLKVSEDIYYSQNQTYQQMQEVESEVVKSAKGLLHAIEDSELTNTVSGIFTGLMGGIDIPQQLFAGTDKIMAQRQALGELGFQLQGITGDMSDARSAFRGVTFDTQRTGKSFTETLDIYASEIKKVSRLDMQGKQQFVESSLNLSKLIGAGAEQTTEMFHDFHTNLMMNQMQMDQVGRRMRETMRTMGIAGNELLAVTEKTKDALNNLKISGNLSADKAGDVIELQAAAEKFGGAETMNKILGIITNPDMQKMESEEFGAMAATLRDSGLSPEQYAKMIQDMSTGAADPAEVTKHFAQGIENRLMSLGLDKDRDGSITEKDQALMSTVENQQAQHLIKTLSGGQMTGMGEFVNFGKAVDEAGKSFAQRMEDLDAKLHDGKIRTEEELAKLHREKTEMVLAQSMSSFTTFGETLSKMDEKATAAQGIDQMRQTMSPEKFQEYIANSTKAAEEAGVDSSLVEAVKAGKADSSDIAQMVAETSFQAVKDLAAKQNFELDEENLQEIQRNINSGSGKGMAEALNAISVMEQKIQADALASTDVLTDIAQDIRGINEVIVGHLGGWFDGILFGVGKLGLLAIALSALTFKAMPMLIAALNFGGKLGLFKPLKSIFGFFLGKLAAIFRTPMPGLKNFLPTRGVRTPTTKAPSPSGWPSNMSPKTAPRDIDVGSATPSRRATGAPIDMGMPETRSARPSSGWPSNMSPKTKPLGAPVDVQPQVPKATKPTPSAWPSTMSPKTKSTTAPVNVKPQAPKTSKTTWPSNMTSKGKTSPSSSGIRTRRRGKFGWLLDMGSSVMGSFAGSSMAGGSAGGASMPSGNVVPVYVTNFSEAGRGMGITSSGRMGMGMGSVLDAVDIIDTVQDLRGSKAVTNADEAVKITKTAVSNVDDAAKAANVTKTAASGADEVGGMLSKLSKLPKIPGISKLGSILGAAGRLAGPLGIGLSGVMGAVDAKENNMTKTEGFAYGAMTGGSGTGSMFSPMLGIEKGSNADELAGAYGSMAYGATTGGMIAGPVGAAVGAAIGGSTEIHKIASGAAKEVEAMKGRLDSSLANQEKLNASTIEKAKGIDNPQEKIAELERLLENKQILVKAQETNLARSKKEQEEFGFFSRNVWGLNSGYKASVATIESDEKQLATTKSAIAQMEKELAEMNKSLKPETTSAAEIAPIEGGTVSPEQVTSSNRMVEWRLQQAAEKRSRMIESQKQMESGTHPSQSPIAKHIRDQMANYSPLEDLFAKKDKAIAMDTTSLLGTRATNFSKVSPVGENPMIDSEEVNGIVQKPTPIQTGRSKPLNDVYEQIRRERQSRQTAAIINSPELQRIEKAETEQIALLKMISQDIKRVAASLEPGSETRSSASMGPGQTKANRKPFSGPDYGRWSTGIHRTNPSTQMIHDGT